MSDFYFLTLDTRFIDPLIDYLQNIGKLNFLTARFYFLWVYRYRHSIVSPVYYSIHDLNLRDNFSAIKLNS